MSHLNIQQLAALSQLYKEKRKADSLDRKYFFIPLVLESHANDYDIMVKNLMAYINNIENVNSILNYAKEHGIIKINKNSKVTLTNEAKNIQQTYDKMCEDSSSSWIRLLQYMVYFSKTVLERDIDVSTIENKLISFLKKPFETLLDKHDMQFPINNISLSDQEVSDITLFLSYIKNNRHELFEFIFNITNGIACLFAISIPVAKPLTQAKYPIIYVDNIFIGRLFGWCSEWNHQSTFTIYKILLSLDCKIYVDGISIAALIEFINNFKKLKQRREKFYYDFP